ncbi:MAG: hypothetical protein AB8G77_26925 [Rhodothermales bacterium]
MKTAPRYWFVAIAAGSLITALGLFELMIRRSAGPSIFLLNKSMAGAAIILIALSYTFSAIHYFSGKFKAGYKLRRPFGIVGYGFSILHIVCTFFVSDPQNIVLKKFPFPEFFLDNWFSIALSAMAFLYFSYACFISFWPKRLLNRKAQTSNWRTHLRYGYVAVVLILGHILALKVQAWKEWFTTSDIFLPPLSLVIGIALAFLIIVKTVHLFKQKRLFKEVAKRQSSKTYQNA